MASTHVEEYNKSVTGNMDNFFLKSKMSTWQLALKKVFRVCLKSVAIKCCFFNRCSSSNKIQTYKYIFCIYRKKNKKRLKSMTDLV